LNKLSLISRDTPLPLISQSLTYVADDASKLPSLLTYLSQPYNPPILIFTSTQPRASSLAEELVLNGIPNVDCLHAGLSKKEREDAVSRMRKGESWVMVSTEVMARGMDFKGVREVINYDFPTSVQSYVHRIGGTFSFFGITLSHLCAFQVALAERVAKGKRLHTLQTKTRHF
jgi:ATP-dependent RNA helicase DDX52/ROK1